MGHLVNVRILTTRMKRAALLLTAVVTAAWLIAPTAVVSAKPGGDCSTSVYFLGARGSNERTDPDKQWNDPANLGGPVRQFYNRVVETAGGSQRIEVVPTTYPAQDVEALALRTGVLRSEFENSMDEGVAIVLDDLRSVVRKIDESECAGAQIVLAGYSQGAMVMHRAILQLVNEDSFYSRKVFQHLTAAYLIADGHRVAHDNMTNEGSGSRWDGGILPLNQKFPLWLADRVFSMCDYLDPVCSLNAATLGLIGLSPAVVGGNALMQGVNNLFGNSAPEVNAFHAHFQYGDRAKSGSGARAAAKLVRVGISSAERESDRLNRDYKPPRPFTPREVVALPDGTTCRDFPGARNDYNAGEGCSALDTARATLISNGVISWPDATLWSVLNGQVPQIDFGVRASGGSTGQLMVENGSGGGADVSGTSTVTAAAREGSLVAAEVSNGSTVSAVVVDGSFAGVVASDGSVVDLGVSGESFGGATAESRSRIQASVEGSSVLVAGALGLSLLEATVTNSSQLGVSVANNSRMSAVLDDSRGSATLADGGQLDLQAFAQSDFRVDIAGGTSSVTLGGQSHADISSVGGAGVTVNAENKSYASVDNRGGSADVKVLDGSIAEVKTTDANAVVHAAAGSRADISVEGASNTSVVPVFRAVATDSARITGVLTSSQGGEVNATAFGTDSRISVAAYELVGTITIVASDGGFAYYYSDEFTTSFGCVSGKTHVWTPNGSCSSDGETTVFFHADGSVDTRGESLAEPAQSHVTSSILDTEQSQSGAEAEVLPHLGGDLTAETSAPPAPATADAEGVATDSRRQRSEGPPPVPPTEATTTQQVPADSSNISQTTQPGVEPSGGPPSEGEGVETSDQQAPEQHETESSTATAKTPRIEPAPESQSSIG